MLLQQKSRNSVLLDKTYGARHIGQWGECSFGAFSGDLWEGQCVSHHMFYRVGRASGFFVVESILRSYFGRFWDHFLLFPLFGFCPMCRAPHDLSSRTHIRLLLSPAIWGPKSDQKWTKKGPEIVRNRPSWGQVGPKIGPRGVQKRHQKQVQNKSGKSVTASRFEGAKLGAKRDPKSLRRRSDMCSFF